MTIKWGHSKPSLLLGFVLGMIILLGLSILQLTFINANPFELKAIIGPIIIGGISGIAIAYLLQKNHRQNNKLKENELKFEALINLSLDGIFLENDRGDILDCNTMGHKMFGYTKEEMLNLNLRDLVPNEFASLLPDIITEEMATGDVYLERENKHRNGTIFPTEINTKFVYLNGKKRLIAYVRDISERKRVEAELKELIATKDKLFSIIGHDLRGAFNNILGFSGLLLSNMKTQDDIPLNKEYLQLIQDSAINANQLLQNLLDWALVQTNKLEFEAMHHELNSLVNDVFDQVKERAKFKSIELVNQTNPDIQVWTDKKLLRTIIRNLLANAVKYSFNEGKITVDSQFGSNKELIISVKDEGIGMSSHTLEGLFDVSQTKIKPGTNKEIGTGLGLIICKDFIEKLNGKIYADSINGEGSTFYIELHSAPK
ncbi:PAS domain-containing sensor histidine kinase [Sunxiuqinia sp. A32]|uniref:PAS domain-containing sensor histidine kinase n=1 Tax=Sunxiuqinia sp. A32 TaxID=3461496 RepID=UPI0040454EC3